MSESDAANGKVLTKRPKFYVLKVMPHFSHQASLPMSSAKVPATSLRWAIALALGLAPFSPEPHLVEKLRMFNVAPLRRVAQ